MNADWLVLLTGVDGFLRPRGRGGKPQLVRQVRRITPAMEADCNGKSKLGRGGMRSKLRAALRATAAGINVVIANGNHPHVIPLALQRRVGTYFSPLRTKAETQS